MKLFIDVETFSDVDLKKAGVYPYFESENFEILLIGYAVDDGPVIVLEYDDYIAFGKFFTACVHADELIAHNAAFERLAFRAKAISLPVWTCTMVKAAFCGLPLGLEGAGEALDLPIKKDLAGKALIRYFCLPCKPTATNGGRTRNRPEDAPEKWQAFKDYLRADVGTTREVYKALKPYEFTDKANYILDQEINDRGVKLDLALIKNAIEIDRVNAGRLKAEAKQLTGLENPNSPAQLSKWLSERTGKNINNLTAESVKTLIESASGEVLRALQLRQSMSNTSVKKYAAALNYACKDGRARGLFQFYGANTGRWAGRGIQLQNLPRNYMRTLGEARQLVKEGDLEALAFIYDDPQQVLKELTRTMLIPSAGKVFEVADFSAIEARVIAWLAGEKWRLEVFETHGKIYEASASLMFGVPFEAVTKESEYRQKGKIAELALGYQGGAGALVAMGGEAMGLTMDEMQSIVIRWRKANPAIKKFWRDVEEAAKQALSRPLKIVKLGPLSFQFDLNVLLIFLPSGRPLIYQKPSLKAGKFGEAIHYFSVDSLTRRWAINNTYGGKLVENIVQAVARDLLAFSMQTVDEAGFKIALHVHDEIVVEEVEASAAIGLDLLIEAMVKKPSWAKGLPLAADGFFTPYYLKA
jgi:DNA polymerase